MLYGKIIDGELSSADISQDEIKMYEEYGYMPVVLNEVSTQLNQSDEEYMHIINYYKEIAGKLIANPVWERDKDAIIKRITILDALLREDDYKIIKTYEYALIGKDLPYDITALNAKRDPLRIEMDKLKALLNE